MENAQRNSPLETSWRKIPAGRRHFYVYLLLALGAVVGNNVKTAVSDVDGDDLEATRAEIARIEGMKESTLSLYR